jgi:Holliday junction resolvasome RuvABC DNA-binding subunit
MVNAEIAERLDEVARLLKGQGANPYRIQAYRRAALTLRGLARPVVDILKKEGAEGLQELPGIGETLARAIRDIVEKGRLPMLERMRTESDPVTLLMTVPGIGKVLAERLHQDLGIKSLEELEAAAHDGRLAMLESVGEKKLAGIREMLASRLERVRVPPRPAPAGAAPPEPPVAELLDVDREYRVQAAAGKLRKIAPRRFNPSHEAWLPVLETERGKRRYMALFSNTARAHDLGKTRDWVVLYYNGGTRGERQCTVITAERGALRGKRIVRGREGECAEYYGARGNAKTKGR